MDDDDSFNDAAEQRADEARYDRRYGESGFPETEAPAKSRHVADDKEGTE